MRRTEYLTEKREFQNLKAGVIMEREVVKAVPSDTGRTIAKQMTEKNIGSLPVVDEEGVLVGLVSEFDLLKHLLNEADLETVTAEQLMSRDVKFVLDETPVEDMIKLLDEEHLIRVPVVKDGKLTGIVARRDILFGYIKATSSYWP